MKLTNQQLVNGWPWAFLLGLGLGSIAAMVAAMILMVVPVCLSETTHTHTHTVLTMDEPSVDMVSVPRHRLADILALFPWSMLTNERMLAVVNICADQIKESSPSEATGEPHART